MQYKRENKRNSNAIDDDQVSKNANLEKKWEQTFSEMEVEFLITLDKKRSSWQNLVKITRVLLNIEKDLTKVTTKL